MEPRSIGRIIAVLLVSTIAAACSSAGKTFVTTDNPEAIPAGKTVALGVKPMSMEANHLQASQLLEAALAARLVADRIFKDVVEAKAAADYALDVKVTKARDVTVGARVMFGFMAPRSYVEVAVELRDRARDEVVETFTSTGYGARNYMSAQGYGLDDPVRELVEQVVYTLAR
jgi:hypothetical protein